jgi:hypothetical protein
MLLLPLPVYDAYLSCYEIRFYWNAPDGRMSLLSAAKEELRYITGLQLQPYIYIELIADRYSLHS